MHAMCETYNLNDQLSWPSCRFDEPVRGRASTYHVCKGAVRIRAIWTDSDCRTTLLAVKLLHLKIEPDKSDVVRLTIV